MKNEIQFSAFLIVLLLVACKPSVPRGYIQPDDMEDILYDYYVSRAIAELQADGEGYDIDPYMTAVLDKHGVSEAEFDTAMVYYTRHADRLHIIYRNIAARMESDAVALGADAREISNFGADVALGDTADIWPTERHMVLIPAMPYNVLSYSIETDTSYHKGDRIVWSFDTQYLYQEGQKNAVAMLVMRYDNDSVASRTKNLTSSTHYTLELPKNDTLALKEVKGFICVLHDANATATTLKLLFVRNIRMIHTKGRGAPLRSPAESGDDARKDKKDTPDDHASAPPSDRKDTTAAKPAESSKPKPMIKEKTSAKSAIKI